MKIIGTLLHFIVHNIRMWLCSVLIVDFSPLSHIDPAKFETLGYLLNIQNADTQ